MTKRLPAAAVTIAAAAITVAGCSSPTEPATQPTTTTTAAPAPTPLGEVQVGDCVLNSELGTGMLYGVSTLTVVDCDTPDSVVVAGPYKTDIRRGDGATTPGIPYLGFPNMAFIAVDECSKLQGVQNPEKKLNYAFPDKTTWDAGAHVIVCVDPSRATGTSVW